MKSTKYKPLEKAVSYVAMRKFLLMGFTPHRLSTTPASFQDLSPFFYLFTAERLIRWHAKKQALLAKQ
jgi:hypothetical protein